MVRDAGPSNNEVDKYIKPRGDKFRVVIRLKGQQAFATFATRSAAEIFATQALAKIREEALSQRNANEAAKLSGDYFRPSPQAVIDRLRRALYEARMDTFRMAPDEAQLALESFLYSSLPFHDWYDSVVRVALVHAVEKGEVRVSGRGKEAKCPLCGKITEGPYGEWFLLPEGLRRHLVGYGNTKQCPVMKAAFSIARDRRKENSG